MLELRIGVVGYTIQKFSEEKALAFLRNAFGRLINEHPADYYSVVAGLTDLGMNRIAYDEALRRKWITKGVACHKAQEHRFYPVISSYILIGSEWGDESGAFIGSIDALVRIGGGEQSRKEAKIMISQGKPVLEYEIKSLGKLG